MSWAFACRQVFFAGHDPTTLNRQKNDVGTQYRSGMYFYEPHQEKSLTLELNATAKKLGKQLTEVASRASVSGGGQH